MASSLKAFSCLGHISRSVDVPFLPSLELVVTNGIGKLPFKATDAIQCRTSNIKIRG